MRRTSTRLLRVVNHKQHATEDDHESSDAVDSRPLPTPPDSARNSRSKRKSATREPAAEAYVIESDDEQKRKVKEKEEEDDILRDPVSSSDEADDMAGGKAGFSGITKGFKPEEKENVSEQAKPFQAVKKSLDLDNGSSPLPKAGFMAPSVTAASIIDPPKREYSDADLDISEDEDPAFIRSSQQGRKRQKTRSQNIHANTSIFTKPRIQQKYGSQNSREEKREVERKRKQEKKGFQPAHVKAIDPTRPAPVFKRANMGHLPAIQKSDTIAGTEDDVGHPEGSPSPEPDSMSIVCETCQERVDKLLKEEYIDDYVKGKSWNIQWQERFCEWHRARSAKEFWEERGYPHIDWTGLEERMRKHDDFLLSVLRNGEESHFRNEYAAKVKAKSMSNGFKDAAVKPGATVGYYGPKGEKVMCVSKLPPCE